LKKVVKVLTVIYRVSFALLGLFVAVTHTLIENKVVDWSRWIVVAGAITVGFLAFFDNVGVIFFKYKAYEREHARSEMNQPCIGALNSITTNHDVPLAKLGISVFAIRGRLELKWRVVPWWGKHLKQVFRFRLSDYPPEVPIRWTKGKGAIGECWQDGVAVVHDRRQAAASYGSRGQRPTKENYLKLPEQIRSGFTFNEFKQTVDNWGEILAMPITERGTANLIGVLSIDCLMDYYTDKTPPITTALDHGDVKLFAGTTAAVVRKDLPKA
jgi:hypothetical protein